MRERPELFAIFVTLLLMATFGMNFTVFVVSMAVMGFGTSAGGFALLCLFLAIGAFTGALRAARREKPRAILLLASAFLIGDRFRRRGVDADVSVVRHRVAGTRLLPADLHGHRQQHRAAVDRARHARMGDGDLHGDLERQRVVRLALRGLVANQYGARWALIVGAAAGVMAAGGWVKVFGTVSVVKGNARRVVAAISLTALPTEGNYRAAEVEQDAR